jgi:hypothetical protein
MQGRRVGLVLTGGNVDLATYQNALQRGGAQL